MTARTKSDRLRRLLSHGYFAPELPPCFVSGDLARYRKAILDGVAALPTIKQKPNHYRYITEPAWFYFPRFGKDDRRHGVPNPISYLLLAKVVADNYVQLRRVAKRSGLSASPPVFDWSGPRSLMRSSVDLRDDFRVDLSSRREQFVTADIRAFFHSIYTHSIPWAIYGKAWAKNSANRDVTHFGNMIDLLSRNMQDGQTIGLPVGPDTSRLLAEVLASAVDEQLRGRLPLTPRDASRYIDDYTIGGVDGSAGEDIIAALRQAAAHFELELNSEKSAVVSTATRHETGWKQATRANIPKGPPADLASMQRFFYEIGRLCEVHPDINVEKFALSNARSAMVRSIAPWKNLQSLLINAYQRNATLVPLLVEILILRQHQRSDVDLENLQEFLNRRLPTLARANRTGEIAWFLLLAVRLRIELSAESIEPLWAIENSMIALLVAVADHRHLVSGPVDYAIWNQFHTADGLRGPMWLYAYQTALQGLVPGTSDAFLREDAYFALLHAKRVSFLDIECGFVSMTETLRALRGDNDRARRVRDDFIDDFQVDIDEVDDVDDEINSYMGY